MSKRITLEALDFDKKLRDLAFSEDDEESAELRSRVKKIMGLIIKDDLTARQKQIIMLYYYENKRVKEIGEELCIAPSTVSRTLKRARSNIYEKLKYYFI